MGSIRLRICICILSALALAISLYILYIVSAYHVIPGCGDDVKCNAVLKSRWERWGPISVASLGIAGYAMLCISSFIAGIKNPRSIPLFTWSLMVVQSLAGIGFIAWLIGLQWVILNHFCVYCLSAHLFGILAFLLVIWRAPVWNAFQHAANKLIASAAVLLAVMIGVHVLVVPNHMIAYAAEDMEFAHSAIASDSSSGAVQIGTHKKSRSVVLLDGELTFDLCRVPVSGPQDATYVALELFDYACPSCRKLHNRLKKYKEKYHLSLALIQLPVPMNPDCNPDIKRRDIHFKNSCTYSRYAMAVNRADPDKFAVYHDFLMAEGWPPAVEKARARAIQLVGEEAFNQALDDPLVDQWIGDGLNIYRFIKGKSIPKLITGKQVISYSGGSRARFEKLLNEALGIPEN